MKSNDASADSGVGHSKDAHAPASAAVGGLSPAPVAEAEQDRDDSLSHDDNLRVDSLLKLSEMAIDTDLEASGQATSQDADLLPDVGGAGGTAGWSQHELLVKLSGDSVRQRSMDAAVLSHVG